MKLGIDVGTGWFSW